MATTTNKQHIKDIHFMKIARQIAEFSKCSSRQIGAVLVKDGCVASTGYNGSARGVSMCQDRSKQCRRKQMGYKSGEGIEHCPAVHAEQNAVIQAARIGVSTNGCDLYCYCGCICKMCAGTCINAGIKRIICLDGFAEYDEYALPMLKEAGVKIDFIPLSDLD